MVARSPSFRPLRSLWSWAWCAQVAVVPDSKRMMVLKSGRCQGSKVWMPSGGQVPPVSAVREYWIASPGKSAASK